LASAGTAASATRALSRSDAAAVERSRSGATKRLQAPECQKLLTDFSDVRGHALRERLEASGLSATDYLQTIAFVDGSSTRSCKRSEVLLVASPGVATVAVCPAEGRPTSRLAQAGLRNHWLAESILIHEMLHTLGLGEDPPATEQITWQVQQRCQP
jgi:hypothetical protein